MNWVTVTSIGDDRVCDDSVYTRATVTDDTLVAVVYFIARTEFITDFERQHQASVEVRMTKLEEFRNPVPNPYPRSTYFSFEGCFPVEFDENDSPDNLFERYQDFFDDFEQEIEQLTVITEQTVQEALDKLKMAAVL